MHRLGELGARTVLGLLPETEPQGLKRIGIWNQTYNSVPKCSACLTGTCFASGELSSEASSSSPERIDRFQLFFAVLLGESGNCETASITQHIYLTSPPPPATSSTCGFTSLLGHPTRPPQMLVVQAMMLRCLHSIHRRNCEGHSFGRSAPRKTVRNTARFRT